MRKLKSISLEFNFYGRGPQVCISNSSYFLGTRIDTMTRNWHSHFSIIKKYRKLKTIFAPFPIHLLVYGGRAHMPGEGSAKSQTPDACRWSQTGIIAFFYPCGSVFIFAYVTKFILLVIYLVYSEMVLHFLFE